MSQTLTEAECLEEIQIDHLLRTRLSSIIRDLRARSFQSAERTLAFRAMQQARQWLGEDLIILGRLTEADVESLGRANRRSGPQTNGPVDKKDCGCIRGTVECKNHPVRPSLNGYQPVGELEREYARQIAEQEVKKLKEEGFIIPSKEQYDEALRHLAGKAAEIEKSKETGLEPNFNVGIDSPVKRDDHGQPA